MVLNYMPNTIFCWFCIVSFIFTIDTVMMGIDAIIIDASDVMTAGVAAMMSVDGFKMPLDGFIFTIEGVKMGIDAIIIDASDVMMTGDAAMMSVDGFMMPIDGFIFTIEEVMMGIDAIFIDAFILSIE